MIIGKILNSVQRLSSPDSQCLTTGADLHLFQVGCWGASGKKRSLRSSSNARHRLRRRPVRRLVALELLWNVCKVVQPGNIWQEMDRCFHNSNRPGAFLPPFSNPQRMCISLIWTKLCVCVSRGRGGLLPWSLSVFRSTTGEAGRPSGVGRRAPSPHQVHSPDTFASQNQSSTVRSRRSFQRSNAVFPWRLQMSSSREERQRTKFSRVVSVTVLTNGTTFRALPCLLLQTRWQGFFFLFF